MPSRSTQRTPDPARAGNVLGALALGLTDRMTTGSASDAAALSALHHFLRDPSIDLVRQVLGLTHSGTVRLVDRLAADGLVRRAAEIGRAHG